MSKPASFTVAKVCKAMTAAERKGYRVAGITANGTVLVYSGDERPAELSVTPTTPVDAEVDTWADR